MKQTGVFITILAAAIWFFFWKPIQERSCIRTVLITDSQNFSRYKKEVGWKELWNQAPLVGKYVSDLRLLNLNGCPRDFRDAYLRRTDEWIAYQKIAEKYGGWAGFVKGLYTGGISAISAYAEASTAMDRITNTEHEITVLAQKYGAVP